MTRMTRINRKRSVKSVKSLQSVVRLGFFAVLVFLWGAQPPRLHRWAPCRPDRVFGEGAEHGTRGARSPHTKHIGRFAVRTSMRNEFRAPFAYGGPCWRRAK